MSVFARGADVRVAFQIRQQMILILYKDSYFFNTNLDSSLPSAISSLLQDYDDVFPKEIPNGLPPRRGIEHHIDLIPGAPIPTKLAYRSNPEDTKEL